MNRVQHISNNTVLAAPDGMSIDECTPLAVTVQSYSDGTVSISSYWKPDERELQLLNKGGLVKLETLGNAMPPVILIAVKETE